MKVFTYTIHVYNHNIINSAFKVIKESVFPDR